MTPALKGYPVKLKPFLMLCLLPLVGVAVAPYILKSVATPSWEGCNTGNCWQQFLDEQRQEEEKQHAEIASMILTPGDPLRWVSDLQNLEAVEFDCIDRDRSTREKEEVLTTLGGDLAGKGVATTTPSAAWRPLVPGPGGEAWINWACSVTKPKPPLWVSINGRMLALATT
jgi:hypothetical protein